MWSENREGDPGWEKILKDGRDVNGVGTNEGSWACHMQRLPLSQHITTHKLTKRWNGEAISKKNAATLEAGWELKSNSYKSTSVQKIMAIDQYIYIYIYINNDPAIRASAFARTFSLKEVKTQLSRVSSTA